MEHKLSMEDMQLMNMLEQMTGARAEDVMFSDESVTFAVRQGDLGMAVGRQGANIARLERAMHRRVEIVEKGNDLHEFLSRFFLPIRIVEIRDTPDGAAIKVNASDRGLAIGRNGEKIKRAKMLAQRYFGAGNVKIL